MEPVLPMPITPTSASNRPSKIGPLLPASARPDANAIISLVHEHNTEMGAQNGGYSRATAAPRLIARKESAP
jgi:hypothetical protein